MIKKNTEIESREDAQRPVERIVKCRTCNGCKALQDEQGMGLVCGVPGYECTLGGVPKKPCPKPRTYRAWISAGI